jgi:cell division inhibitor SepF
MSVFKRAMDYLGLGPDDAYDDYDLPPAEPEPRGRGGYDPDPRPMRPRPSQGGYDDDMSRQGPPRSGLSRGVPGRDDPVPARRPSPLDDSNISPRPARQGSSTVRLAPPAPAEPLTVRPQRFEHAQEVADKFKSGQPVIMNIEGSDRADSRRLIDFASGLCYGLDGTMEKVATGVYLLKPALRTDDRHDYGY